MKRYITLVGILTCIAISLKIGLLRNYDYEYYFGSEIIGMLLFGLLAYNTIWWNRVISFIVSGLCAFKAYDIYKGHGEVLQRLDFIILTVAAGLVIFIYIKHRRKHVNK